jgi:hypothetical protein
MMAIKRRFTKKKSGGKDGAVSTTQESELDVAVKE